MRNLDNNRVEGFVKKHVFLKRWISVMLVVALLVTCVTMYALNKAASAVSEETAEDVGMVLEGENEQEESSEPADTNEDETEDDASTTEENLESEETGENSNEETESEISEENVASEDSDAETESDTESSTEETSNEESESEENGASDSENTEEETTEEAEDSEKKEENALLSGSGENELTESVVLTASYVNEADEKIADDNEISLSESLDLESEAPEQEGYEFKQASIDGTVITKITAKADSNDHTYYVATLKDGQEKAESEPKGDAEAESKDDAEAEAKGENEVEAENAAETEPEVPAEDPNLVVIKENKTVVFEYREIQASKTEYVYENEKVRVVATLEKASAIPDDAEFVVTEVTADTQGYDYDAYMKALNNGEESTLANHNELNTILYDVAFMVNKTDENGNVIEGEKVEYQPEEGSVSIKFEFLDNQLEDLSKMAEVSGEDADKNEGEVKAESSSDDGVETSIEVTHMPLNEEIKNSVDSTAEATDLDAADINTVAVDAEVNTEGEAVEMSLDNFSIVSMSTIKLGADGTFIYDKNGRRLTYKQNNKTDAFVESSYYNSGLALGVAGNFHVVAFDKAEFTTHVNGNVLAKNFSTNSDFGTRNIANELSYVQNLQSVTETMASGDKHVLALGSSVNVGINDENFFQINNKKVSKPYNVIQDKNTAQNPYINIEQVRANIQAISNGLAATSNGAVSHGTNRNNASFYTFNYTGDGGAGYVNLRGSQWNQIVSGRAVEFRFPQSLPNQAIIINIDCSDVYEIKWPTKASDVYVNGKLLAAGETPNVNDGRIVYNFINANGKSIKAIEVFGQIIALGANLEVDKGDGNFIAQNVKITGETHRRDFVGTTTKSGAIIFTGKKVIDGGDVPSEFANGKFEFAVDVYNNSRGWVAIGSSYNEGKDIKFDVTNAITGAGKYYFRIHEVVPTNANDRISGMTYDTRFYLADVDVVATTENTSYGTNIRYSIGNITYHVSDNQNIQWSDKCVSQIKFNNKTAPKTGMLRIHKMVVNDYGSKFVRDATGGAALLDKVTFRITNNETKNYIVLKGFTGKAGDTGVAEEYDSKTHKTNGKKYTVTYNQSAQWTIEGLSFGTYSVEEVADGYTFSYNASSNSSSAIEYNNLSRVTKYDVTVDAEESNEGRKSPLFGTGGNNYRAVFSKDIKNKVDTAPTYVVVGDTTQTVQVCNYYSIPVAPIQISKNFAGGEWNKNMGFTFKVEPIGYSARVSEGGAVTLKSQPMPYDANGNATDTVTVTGADAVKNNDGTYTAVARFGVIPFRYEGTYCYKITEIDTGIDGVQYDLKKVYYAKIEVSKKYTTFKKTYTYDHMTHPAKYTSDTTLDEDFFYLGADVVYSDKEDFSNELASCELKLGTNPDTSKPENNVFLIEYKNGTSILNTMFKNTLKGYLEVEKVWLDSEGNAVPGNYTELTLDLWQRTEGGKWHPYETMKQITLSAGSGWKMTVSDLPIMDENGKKYQYAVKESDEMFAQYYVTYNYNGKEIIAYTQKDTKIGGTKTKDTGYSMTVGKDGRSYGKVVITNKDEFGNVLPAAGGMGTKPYLMAGIVLIMIALAGMFIFGRKKA